MAQGVVQVTVTRGIPVLLVIVSGLWTGEQGLFVDAWVPRLIKGDDLDLLIGILLNDTERVFMGIERGHKDKRNVDTLGGVAVLELVHGKVEESHAVFDLERALRPGHTCIAFR